MWIVCITSVRHVLTVNGYGGRQTKENEKSWCFKGWETLVKIMTDDIFYVFQHTCGTKAKFEYDNLLKNIFMVLFSMII